VLDVCLNFSSKEHWMRILGGECAFELQFSQTSNTFLTLVFFLPWRWRRHILPKCRFILNPHGATSQHMVFFTVAAVKTSNPTRPWPVLRHHLAVKTRGQLRRSSKPGTISESQWIRSRSAGHSAEVSAKSLSDGHRKFKRLKLGGGQAYHRSSD
jgi:hypothetical protein